jgi:hypothetical protein
VTVDPFEDDDYDDSVIDDDVEQDAAPELYFASLDLFMDWFVQIYRRSTQGHNRLWCPDWWRHPEAIARLEALWRAFEHLRLDPALGMSVWWRDHVDPHLTVLTDPDGPLKGCSVEKGHAERPVPAMGQTPAPAGLFERDDDGVPPPRPSSEDAGVWGERSSTPGGPARTAEHSETTARRTAAAQRRR